MKIQEIPGKMVSTWEADVKAVLDTWTTYHVTLQEFENAVLIKGVNFAKANGGIAWIVDSSTAKGVFSQEIQEFIGSTIFPAFVQNGIKFFITIRPNIPGFTNVTVSTYSFKVEPAGLHLVDVKSVSDAKMWLNEHSND
jgi:hypothetical protein